MSDKKTIKRARRNLAKIRQPSAASLKRSRAATGALKRESRKAATGRRPARKSAVTRTYERAREFVFNPLMI